MSILIVDDEPEVRTLLSEILTGEGFQVRAADRGALALASLHATPVSLILLDIHMPGMDGFDVCRELKRHPHTRDIPVIFISADGEMPERLKGFRLGAVDFISKPFQREELLARVRTHVELFLLRAGLERRVAERTDELRESEERFRALSDAAPVMIWTTAPDKSCDFVSRGWLEFTGRSLAQEVGSGWAESIHADYRAHAWNIYSSSFDERANFEMEYLLRRFDGEYRWILDRGVPRFSPDGRFAGYVGTCVDITDLKQTHERMLSSQKLESLGVMAAGVAHDFGNLLGAIMSEADLALSDLSPDDPTRENLERIVAVAARGSEIVHLLMASGGAGIAALQNAPIDLSLEVEHMLRLLVPTISRRSSVRTTLPRHLPPVLGNAAQIHQIVLNLVGNASEALPEKGGSIAISTERASLEARSARALDLPPGHYVRLRVADNGRGMSPETRARIFDPFFTTKPKGRGLGLAAVHGIVRSHGGAIRVESAPGAGTTFDIFLPCQEAARAAQG